MRAGELNRRVTIQQHAAVADGEPFPTAWVDVATVWASMKSASGLQTIKSGVDVSVVKSSIRIRYRTDVTAGMRVVYQDQVFDIRAVLPDTAGRVFLDLVCESGQNQG